MKYIYIYCIPWNWGFLYMYLFYLTTFVAVDTAYINNNVNVFSFEYVCQYRIPLRFK